MLQSLRVKNLAIVENIRADFGPGLNVITGETGAGKSVIVGALGLVLGERADKSLIRTGEDRGGVEAVFRLADAEPLNTLLEELGLDPCEDGLLVIRRIVATSGSGRVLVNDGAATVQALKSIGTLLIDMHGPHDHQSLLDPAFQLDLLDAFGRLWDVRADYEKAYDTLRRLATQRAALEGDDEDVAARIDLLRFQVREIREAELDGLSEETLVREHTAVANAQRILEIAGTACRALTDSDDGTAFDALVAAQQALRDLAPLLPEAEAWIDDAESAAVQVQELSNAVSSRAQSIETDSARMQWLDDRLTLLRKLQRKYGPTVEAILAAADKAEAALEELESRGERLAALDRDIAAARADVEARGETLRADRHEAAIALGAAITEELNGLGFAHGAFRVDLAPCEPGPAGMDDVDFGFAPNVGEAMRPLKQIASSGEISRVMLATKAVLAAHDRIPVLVFDEIDANLGGEMGDAVGARLAAVAATHQVLCITHLPQVAVYGATHFVVTKSVAAGRTRTSIAPLDQDARAEEIARMLGGKDMTRVTLDHAREMLKRHPPAP